MNTHPHIPQRKHRPAWLLILIGVILIAGLGTPGAPLPVKAQSGGDYGLAWSSAGDGAETLTGGAYMLYSAAGQPEASLAVTSGGSYTLTGGVFSGSQIQFNLFMPDVQR